MEYISAVTVHVQGRVFRPGDVVPERYAAKMGVHCFRDGAPSPTPDGDAEIPPKTGKGSSKTAWAEYAAANDVEVAEDASREDIWAALEAAGVATGE
jgi:hypothetical protein